jgi:hypothetical protein
MSRLTVRQFAEMLADARAVNLRDLYDDAQDAISLFYPTAPIRLYDVGEVDLGLIAGSRVRFGKSMDDFWSMERTDNLIALRGWRHVLMKLKENVEAQGRDVRAATLDDVRYACLDAEERTDEWGVPEAYEFSAATEFGRMIGIMRWIDANGADVLDRAPVIANWNARRGKLVLLDGWHRVSAAYIRRWSSIRTIAVVRG